MKKKILLDSFALLAYLEKENNYQKVVDILSGANQFSVIMNEINVGESYYIISRERSRQYADYFIETILPNLPIILAANSFNDVIEASKIKADYSISYADCFAVSTAVQQKATIITGDPEFKKVENLVGLEWL